MNKKVSVGVCVSLIAIACAVTFVVTWTVSFNMYNERFPGFTQRDEISSKLQEIDAFVRNNYPGIIDDSQIAYGIFNGYILGIGDKNTVYMTKEEYSEFLITQEGEVITCGIIPEKQDSGYVVVSEVYYGTSAAAVGIQKGDTIISIDGNNVLDIGTDAAIKLLEGEEGTRVHITVQREGEVFGYPLVRQAIEVVSVEYAVVNNVGFIRIISFNKLTAEQFNSALQAVLEHVGEPAFDEEEPRQTKAIVIDVRQVTSGYYDNLGEILSPFIGSELIAQTQLRNNLTNDFITTTGEKTVDVPVIIMADSATSGTPELMAASLKTFAGSIIVGNNTMGDATLQTLHRFKDLSGVLMTIAQIRPTDFEYAGVGIAPDYAIDTGGETIYELSRLAELENITEITDPYIIKAFEIIETIT